MRARNVLLQTEFTAKYAKDAKETGPKPRGSLGDMGEDENQG
jgi:hypothetical protein